ncbi:MAG: LacI family DNA-binding transcriptional regulator [Roseinatronobacter sp.]
MQKRVSLKMLAEKLRVDVSTVSRALRDDPRVKPETRDMVQALARQLDYRPNAAARALKAGQSGRIAVLLSPPQQRFASPIFLELLSTLDQHLRDTGRNLAVFAARTRDEEAELVRQIIDEGLADGVVLGRTRKDDPRIRFLLNRAVPFVTLGRTDWPDAHPWVEIDYTEAGRLAVRALCDARTGELHIVAAPEGLNFADYYVTGALEEAARLGLPNPRLWRVEMTEAEGARIARHVLAQPGPAPRFACIQDSLAFGVFRAATAAGAVVGRDLTIFGGQNFPGSEHTSPPLSTFSTADRQIAILLSQVMLRRLEQTAQGPFETHTVLPTLVLRQSHKLAQIDLDIALTQSG